MKLQMKVLLTGEKSLSITLIHVCDEALKSGGNDNKLYQDPYNPIIIWSYGTFGFDERQIRFPERKLLLSSLSHTHVFNSEKERYETMRNYYHTLTSWSLSTRMFPNTDTLIKDRVRMRNTYWVVI